VIFDQVPKGVLSPGTVLYTINVRFYALQLHDMSYNWGNFPCPRAHENAVFNCLQTTKSPEGIPLVRSCRCGNSFSNNPATWTRDQVRKGVI